MQKRNNLKELLRFAGRHRFLTYSSWALSVLSAALALVPFVCIFFIIREAIEVAPNFSEAKNIVFNGWMAVAFSLASIAVYVGALTAYGFAKYKFKYNKQLFWLVLATMMLPGQLGIIGYF